MNILKIGSSLRSALLNSGISAFISEKKSIIKNLVTKPSEKEEETKFPEYHLPPLDTKNPDEINTIGEQAWIDGRAGIALQLFQISARCGSERGFQNETLHCKDSNKRDDLFQKVTKDSLNINLDRQYLLDQDRDTYEKKLLNISQAIEKKLGIKINTGEMIEDIYFQRRLGSELGDHVAGGVYSIEDGKIGIDATMHLIACILGKPHGLYMLEQTLCHEVTHKITRESDTSYNPPRFFDEGLVKSLENYVLGAYSPHYYHEQQIFEKFIELNHFPAHSVYLNCLNGHASMMLVFFNQYLNQIIDFFSKKEGFEEIVNEMKTYRESVPKELLGTDEV